MITQSTVKGAFYCNEEDGVLRWRESNYFHVEGEAAGKILDNDYISVPVGKRHYMAHRLIYLYFNGELPDIVEHKDGNKLNNRPENLIGRKRVKRQPKAPKQPDLTHEELLSIFEYREDGRLLWRENRGSRGRSGTPAGVEKDNGVVAIRVNGKLYQANKLVYFYHHKTWPKMLVHVNGNKRDNRVENLAPKKKQVKTRFFENYEAFRSREDKTLNGVSRSYLIRHRMKLNTFVDMNKTNIGCWCCSDSTGCSHSIWLRQCSDCHESSYLVGCRGITGGENLYYEG